MYNYQVYILHIYFEQNILAAAFFCWFYFTFILYIYMRSIYIRIYILYALYIYVYIYSIYIRSLCLYMYALNLFIEHFGEH